MSGGEKLKYNKALTATVYVINNGRVLLHLHKRYNTWFPVGGHFEEDELPHEAAVREVREESGFDVTLFSKRGDDFSIGLVKRVPTPLLVYNEGDRKNGGEDFLDFIYCALTDESEPSSGENESTVFRWFSKEELLDSSENIKIHIRNTALYCLYYVTEENSREYFPEDSNAIF